MKKIFWALTFAALLPWSIAAQDARQRTIATIIADALDQLPAAKQQDYNNIMNELMSTGTAGIVLLGEMLVPADKGKNASIEHALYGVVSYVTAPDKADKRAEVRKGLAKAIEKCTDNPFIFVKDKQLKDTDPETNGSDAFPTYRQFVFGVNLTF